MFGPHINEAFSVLGLERSVSTLGDYSQDRKSVVEGLLCYSSAVSLRLPLALWFEFMI